jgi:hypothetical protein
MTYFNKIIKYIQYALIIEELKMSSTVVFCTSKDEIFVAGAGDDTLTGNGGMDVFNAGLGKDSILINASNISALEQTGAGNRARVDGGGGKRIERTGCYIFVKPYYLLSSLCLYPKALQSLPKAQFR